MSFFNKLTNNSLEAAEDRLGGSTGAFNTDIYKGLIKLAYAGKAKSGAQNITYVISMPNGQEYKETVYVTNKAGENFYTMNGDSSKKFPLPGFTLADQICMIAGGTPLSETTVEDKVIKLMNWDTRKEEPQTVPVLVDLLNKPIAFALIKELVNKEVADSSGKYQPTEETREQNTIAKVFDPESMMTVNEALDGKTEGEFHTKWLEKNKDKVVDKRKIKEGQSAPSKGVVAGKPPARSGLFGNKS